MSLPISSRIFSSALVVLLIFGAVSAFGGAVLAIVFNGAGVPLEHLAGTPFSTFFIPGLILGGILGGTQLVAALALLRRRHWALLMAAIAGFGMLIWIFIELAIVGYSWLQSVYFGLGVLELALVLALLGIAPTVASSWGSPSVRGPERAVQPRRLSRVWGTEGRPDRGPKDLNQLPALWVRLSVAAAVLAAAGSVVGLLVPEMPYGRETSALFDAAAAQDLVNLFLVAPLLLVLAVRAGRGSLRSWLCLLGLLAFTLYNYAIYAFSIQFGPLFLLWVAVLGLSCFALAGSFVALCVPELQARFAGTAVRLPGWFLIVMAVVFALLWLSAIVPDLLAGRPSTSATSWNIPTDPVHVLDLAFFLPAVCAIGMLLLRRRRIGFAAAPGALIWLGVTSLPILITPLVALTRGGVPGWFVMIPIGVITVATAAILWRLLRSIAPCPDFHLNA